MGMILREQEVILHRIIRNEGEMFGMWSKMSRSEYNNDVDDDDDGGEVEQNENTNPGKHKENYAWVHCTLYTVQGRMTNEWFTESEFSVVMEMKRKATIATICFHVVLSVNSKDPTFRGQNGFCQMVIGVMME